MILYSTKTCYIVQYSTVDLVLATLACFVIESERHTFPRRWKRSLACFLFVCTRSRNRSCGDALRFVCIYVNSCLLVQCSRAYLLSTLTWPRLCSTTSRTLRHLIGARMSLDLQIEASSLVKIICCEVYGEGSGTWGGNDRTKQLHGHATSIALTLYGEAGMLDPTLLSSALFFSLPVS